MSKDKESEIQMSIRMAKSLNEECTKLADEAGQTLAEWIRRAMREKADRAAGAGSKLIIDKNELKALMRECQKELKEEEKN